MIFVKFKEFCNFRACLLPPKIPCPFVVIPCSLRQSQATTNLFSSSYRLADFWTFPIKGIIPYAALCVWLLPCGIMSLRLIHLQTLSVVCSFSQQIFHSVAYATFCLLFHFDEHLSCFHFVSKAAMNFASFQGDIGFHLSWKVHRSGISGSYCKFMFHFLRNGQMVCQSGCRFTFKKKKKSLAGIELS